jgi:aryl-alcohol dehydrogenase-like predicted oxidoreductase
MKLDLAESKQLLHAAVEEGINFIDLADSYAHGAAERAVGEFLPEFRRSDLVISSKVFFPMSDDPNDRGLGRKHIMASVDRSLENLQTDYLDIYFCHREDRETPIEETLRAMDDLIHQGKILYWGTSLWHPRRLRTVHSLARKNRLVPPIVEQPPYNLLERWIEKRVAPMAEKLGMGLMVWSPLAGGVLTGKYNEGIPEESRAATGDWVRRYLNDGNVERTRRFCDLAAEIQVDPAQLALAWLLRRSVVSSVITGASSVRQLRSNAAAAGVEIPKEIDRKINRLFPR